MNFINHLSRRERLRQRTWQSMSSAHSSACQFALQLHHRRVLKKEMPDQTRRLIVAALLLAALARANAEDYAARYKQLEDQKAADAQIEPLLNEWREKAPNDPEGWIASANYYFNKRQVKISTKPAGKGAEIPAKP